MRRAEAIVLVLGVVLGGDGWLSVVCYFWCVWCGVCVVDWVVLRCAPRGTREGQNTQNYTKKCWCELAGPQKTAERQFLVEGEDKKRLVVYLASVTKRERKTLWCGANCRSRGVRQLAIELSSTTKVVSLHKKTLFVTNTVLANRDLIRFSFV